MIRPATLADLDSILALERATPTAPHWSPADYTAMLAADRVLLVAAEGPVLTGFAAASLTAGLAELESVAVRAESQRQGIGRQLCLSVLAWAREGSAEAILLEVRAASLGPQALYRSLGFAATGLRTRYYADPPDDAVLMQCALA